MNFLNLLVILVGLTLIKVQSQGRIERIIADTAEEYGYPFEEHTVTTEDGYILTLHRIPHGLEDSYSPGRPAVLFQHGTYDSSDALVVHGPELSPAFYWANSGYDVWIANSRGNKYSLEHTTLTTDDPEYWEFSIVHMPRDHRANVQFIIDETGLEQISIIGFSAIGGAYLIAFNDDNDWWRERVNLFIGIGISTILTHTASPNFHLITMSRGFMFPILREMGIHYMFPSGYLQNPLFYRA